PTQHIANPDDILGPQGLIEAELLADGLDRLGRCVVAGIHECRITGDQSYDDEDHHAGSKHRQDALDGSLEEVARHVRFLASEEAAAGRTRRAPPAALQSRTSL